MLQLMAVHHILILGYDGDWSGNLLVLQRVDNQVAILAWDEQSLSPCVVCHEKWARELQHCVVEEGGNKTHLDGDTDSDEKENGKVVPQI